MKSPQIRAFARIVDRYSYLYRKATKNRRRYEHQVCLCYWWSCLVIGKGIIAASLAVAEVEKHLRDDSQTRPVPER